MESISDRIRQFIVQQFPLARQQALADDDALLGSGIIDSMGVLDIVNFIETEFGLTIFDDELILDNFETIGLLAVFVQTKLETTGTPAEGYPAGA